MTHEIQGGNRIVMTESSDLISKIKGNKSRGGSIIDGKLYHDLPFPGFEKFKSHRSKTKARWDHISKYVSFKDKTVIDVGCSVGAFSILASLAGAKKVVGVDHDKESIEVARYVAKEVGANVEFVCHEINFKFLQDLEYFDVVIWLSHWMWLVKQIGLSEAKRCLYFISENSSTMIFESAADDGLAKIKGMTQEKLEEMFRATVAYSSIKNIGITPGWKKRNILIGDSWEIVGEDSPQ